ncbi:MAG: hypothetical protein EA398_09690 [Deltaproteobacteria bacterium]|nr:MAG: hypothetical protein EA398_09690 [Deltaproteobacteria bacterium]
MSEIIVGLEPSISVCENLLLVQEELSAPLHQLGVEPRWTPAEDLRLVLLRWRNVDADAVRLFTEQLRVVCSTEPEGRFSVSGVGFAPSEEVPRLLLAEVEAGDALRRLRERLGAAAGAVGLGSAAAWRPAMRLGRMSTPTRFMELRGIARSWAQVEGWESLVREVVIWRSSGRTSAPWAPVHARVRLGTGQ